MGYYLALTDPVSGDTLHTEDVHHMHGGTYRVGGTTSMDLNVTYNYCSHYSRSFKGEGLNSLNGLTGQEAIVPLSEAADKLGDEVSDNYWEGTEGNAKRALLQLLVLSRMRPDGVWSVS